MEVKSYDLFMDISFGELKYSGDLVARLETETDLVLNSVGLKIIRISADGKDLGFAQKEQDLTVETGQFSGALRIEYEGAIPDLLTGLYRAPYEGGYVVSTQFESIGARRMFPCLDNPGYKAEFGLSVRVEDGLNVISNMPVESRESSGGRTKLTFKRTPRMSTYLLYLGIGKFEEVRDRLNESVDLFMATAPGKVQKGGYALDVAKRAVAFYERYFGIRYMLPKLHLIAVPEFAAGAMENWGAITFRESALLIDKDSAVETKKRVAEVVSHELAHQWFGDLVTMKWWNDLWLNESFATFMASKAMAELYPQWRVWDDFLNGETADALSRDSLRNTHPIEAEIKVPSDIEQIFDAISYGKGGSILRMIDAYVGAEEFRKGVSSYLKEHGYSNAAGTDLWTAVEASSGKSVTKIMSEWVKRAGYPEVTASMDDGRLVLKQRRFLISGEEAEGVWPIPLTIKMNGRLASVLMEGEEMSMEVRDVSSLKLNVDQTGFYRVYYDGIQDLVWKGELSDFDKWGMVSDATAFLVSGRMPLGEYLKTVERYLGEEGYLPALEVSDQLASLNSIVPSRFEALSRKFHRSQLELLKGKDDENSTVLRGTIAARLAVVDEAYARELGARFRDYDSVEPDMRDAVAIAYAVGYGDFEGLLRRYRERASDEDKVRHLAAMMRLGDPSLVALALGLGLSGEVKRQDVRTMLRAGASNPRARGVVWLWLKANVQKVRKMYEGTGALSAIFLALVPILGIGRAEEVERFFAENKFPEGEKGILAGLERLKVYDEFVKSVQRAPQNRRVRPKSTRGRGRGSASSRPGRASTRLRPGRRAARTPSRRVSAAPGPGYRPRR